MNIRTAVGLTFVIAVGVCVGSVAAFFIEAIFLAILKGIL